MKQTINFNNFVDAFKAYNRMDNFSYDALKAIFEYIEDYERDSGEEQELDVIAICCEFSEMSKQEFMEYYSIPDEDRILHFLDKNTGWYVELDNDNIVFIQF